MDPSSTLLLFALFYATEKVIGYAGGKITDLARDKKEDGGVRSAAYQSLKVLLGGG
jgi:hypothetical protein